MSRKAKYTDAELRRILEESDFESIEANSSDGGECDVSDFDSDDNMADPDFFPDNPQAIAPTNSDSDDGNNIAINAVEQAPRKASRSAAESQMKEYDVSDFDSEDSMTAPVFFPESPTTHRSSRQSIDSDSDDDNNIAINAVEQAPRKATATATESQMKENDEQNGWSYGIQPLDRQIFSGEGHTIHTENVPENADVCTIFRLLVDDNVLDLMIKQTNIYAEQLITNNPGGRMSRWKPVNKEDMEKFLGIYLLTGIIKFPKLECYWKKDPIFYHPLIHNIQMSYNRFVAILRCWHFVDNTAERDANDRLYKVSPVIDIVMRNCRKLLTPKDCIVVDESMVPFQGRLLIRQYNPNKRHKYGVKIYKATTDDGYVWKYKVYSGQDPQIDNLDKPGSVVVNLCEELLDQGRMIVADNWYTSLPLANYLLQRKTDLCGTLRKNRKNLPLLVRNKKLKRGEQIAAQKSHVTILKWKDKRDVLMISTCHADEQTISKGRNKRLKPNMILEYNDRKKGIDLSDELSSYYSPIRKSLRWYKKIAVDVLFGVGVTNTVYLYNKLNQQKQFNLLQAHTDIVKNLLGVQVSNLPAPLPPQSGSTTSTSQRANVPPTVSEKHFLTQLDRKDAKLTRRRCAGCYNEYRLKGAKPAAATTKAKKVSQICNICTKPYCLQCFQRVHKNIQ